MVDKKLKFLSKNKLYGVIKNDFTIRSNTIGKIVYANGDPLIYGDRAEIFSVLNLEDDFSPFIDGALSETYFTREHYGFTFGYLEPSFDDDGIKEDEVSIHYAGVDSMIYKKEFYELCLLLCEAKLNGLDLEKDIELGTEELLEYKVKLEDKIAKYIE